MINIITKFSIVTKKLKGHESFSPRICLRI